jgi:hypothetical protein
MNSGVPNGPGGKIPPKYIGRQVLKCAISGCGNAPTVLASLPDGYGYSATKVPSALTLDATAVYWAEDASVVSCSKQGCGCSPRVVATASGPAGVAVGSGGVYFTIYGYGDVASCPIAGCAAAPPNLATGQVGPAGITLDTTNVYWTTNSTVAACALGGCNGAPAILWRGAPNSTQANTIGIAVDATNLYWTNAQPFNLGDAMQCAKSSCGSTLVTLASARSEPRGVGVDAQNVYWVEGAGVMKCAIGGCNDSPTMFYPTGSPAIALDASHVYFTDPGATSTDGRIMMLAK